MRTFRPLDAPGRRIGRANQQIDLFGLHDRRGREVPKVLADQDSDAAEPRGVERHEPIAGREIPLLVEQPIGRQIHLAMDVDYPSPLGPERGVVESVMRRLFDEAHDQRHRPGGVDQLPNLRPGGRDRQIGHHVADEIAGQRQFGKDDQVGVLPPGGLDLLQVQGEVARHVAELRRDLSHRHPQHAGRIVYNQYVT